MGAIEVGVVVVDAEGREGIVVAEVAAPPNRFVAEARGIVLDDVPADARWVDVMGLGGGAFLAPTTRLEMRRDASRDDLLAAVSGADEPGVKRLIAAFPDRIANILGLGRAPAAPWRGSSDEDDGLDLGDVVLDNRGREGIVVGEVPSPTEEQIRAQGDPALLAVDPAERWLALASLVDGAAMCPESLVVRLRAATATDLERAVVAGDAAVFRSLAGIFPDAMRGLAGLETS